MLERLITASTTTEEGRMRNECGATLLEFSICGVVLLILIGALIDFGIGFQRWNLLNYITGTVAREYAVKLNSNIGGPGVPCQSIQDEIRDRTISLFREKFAVNSSVAPPNTPLSDAGNSSKDYQIEAALTSPSLVDPDDPRPMLLQVKAQLKLRCFVCLLIPSDVIMTARSEMPVEDHTFECTAL